MAEENHEFPHLANGQKAIFEYRAENAAANTPGELRWTLAAGSAEALDTADIVGVFPSHTDPEHAHQVVYVRHRSDPDPNTPPEIEVLAATGLPPDFIADFKAGDFLSRREDDPIDIIVSTKAGTEQGIPFVEQQLPTLLSAAGLEEGRDYTIHRTSSATSISTLASTKYAPRARSSPTPQQQQRILLLSGDGGIHDLINILAPVQQQQQQRGGGEPTTYHGPRLALLPFGTGNALANSTPILTRDRTVGLSSLVRGRPRPLRAFRATFSPGARELTAHGTVEVPLPRASTTVDDDEAEASDAPPTVYGAVVVSWGLHATLVADSDTPTYRRMGEARFAAANEALLFPPEGKPHRFRGRIEVLPPPGGNPDNNPTTAWEPLDGTEHLYVTATMVSHLARGFRISPASTPWGAARLRLVYFGPVSGTRAMGLMGKAFEGGGHVEERDVVVYREVEGLRVVFEEREGRWRRVCVDGRVVRVEEGGWVEVRMVEGGVVDVLSL